MREWTTLSRQWFPKLSPSIGKFLPEGLAKSEWFAPGAQTPLFPISRGRRKEDLAAAVKLFIPRTLDELIRGIGGAIYEELTRLQYLGPLRSYPPRHLAFSQHHDPNWYAGGGYAWDVVRKDAEVRKKVNAWLSVPGRLQTPYELQIRYLLTIDDLYDEFSEIITDIEFKSTSVGKYEGVEFKGDLFGEEIPSCAGFVRKRKHRVEFVDCIRASSFD